MQPIELTHEQYVTLYFEPFLSKTLLNTLKNAAFNLNERFIGKPQKIKLKVTKKEKNEISKILNEDLKNLNNNNNNNNNNYESSDDRDTEEIISEIIESL